METSKRFTIEVSGQSSSYIMLSTVILSFHLYRVLPSGFFKWHFSDHCFVSISVLFDIFPTRCNVTQFIYFWKTALHVSGGISTHHQEHTELYLQYLVLVKPLLLPAAIAAGKSNGLTSTRYCKYNSVCSWWWVEIPPETCRAVFQK